MAGWTGLEPVTVMDSSLGRSKNHQFGGSSVAHFAANSPSGEAKGTR
jgi:hypothetical protein